MMRPSEIASLFKEPKEKTHIVNDDELRRSNFVALGSLNDNKEEKLMAFTMNPSQLRMSTLNAGILTSPKRILQPKTDKLNYFNKTMKLS